MFKKYLLITSLGLVFSSAALALTAQVNYTDPHNGSTKKIIIQNPLNDMHIGVLKGLIYAKIVEEVNNKFALPKQMIACGSGGGSGNRILSDFDFTHSCSQQNFDNGSGLMQFDLTSTDDKQPR
ncbi:MAG: hypothetical protein V4471_06685 [Pseudomonadota bacterium]